MMLNRGLLNRDQGCKGAAKVITSSERYQPKSIFASLCNHVKACQIYKLKLLRRQSFRSVESREDCQTAGGSWKSNRQMEIQRMEVQSLRSKLDPSWSNVCLADD